MSSSQKTVLIIEDEADAAELFAEMMRVSGFHVMKTSSSAPAIAMMTENKPDVVILDIMMPEMDGWETCQEIRNHWDTPIIMLTARDSKEDIVKGLKGGADDYISKPFKPQELYIKIMNVIAIAAENVPAE